MPTMLVSSPSSAALQSGAASCSPRFPSIRRSSQPYSAASPVSTSISPAAATAASTAVANNDVAPTSQHRSSHSSLLLSPGVEEIRAALRKHTVTANPHHHPPAEPSGDNSRGSMSSGPETLGGESRKLSSDTAAAAAGAATAPVALSTSDDSAEPLVTSTSGQTISPASVKRQLPETTDVDPEASAQGAAKSDDAEKSRSKRVRPPAPAVKLLPRRYELADPVDIVVLISGMIMELIHYNDNIPLQGGKLTRFHSRTPPRISVGDYLQRITTHATLSPPILLSMVFYIDRLCALYPAFTISSLTVHRFLIVSATVASKGLSDSFWTNKTYARVGGISVSELAMLELDFLWRLKWQIVPQPEDLVIYYENLVKRSDLYALQPETEPSQPPCVENAP